MSRMDKVLLILIVIGAFVVGYERGHSSATTRCIEGLNQLNQEFFGGK